MIILSEGDCSDAIMNIGRTPDVEDPLLVIENAFIEHLCHRLLYDWFPLLMGL